ncbi:MAG TPA: hypothetical protein VL595_20540 [Pseudonocardia sp.]|jgi:hypothetical protein|nr:hypothetical protein [Pseudonocardia sp.]
MWWQDAITVAGISLAMVSVITALLAAALVIEPEMAAHCGTCGRAMIDSHLDGTPVCLHCRHDHHLVWHRHEKADHGLTMTSGGV